MIKKKETIENEIDIWSLALSDTLGSYYIGSDNLLADENKSSELSDINIENSTLEDLFSKESQNTIESFSFSEARHYANEINQENSVGVPTSNNIENNVLSSVSNAESLSATEPKYYASDVAQVNLASSSSDANAIYDFVSKSSSNNQDTLVDTILNALMVGIQPIQAENNSPIIGQNISWTNAFTGDEKGSTYGSYVNDLIFGA